MRTAALGLLLAALGGATSACGPIGYITKVSRPSIQAQKAAEAEQAEELAPYEYWAGMAYLEQSRRLMGYSEYERAFDYGNRAEQLFKSAQQKALRLKNAGDAPASVTDSDSPAAADLRPAPARGEEGK